MASSSLVLFHFHLLPLLFISAHGFSFWNTNPLETPAKDPPKPIVEHKWSSNNKTHSFIVDDSTHEFEDDINEGRRSETFYNNDSYRGGWELVSLNAGVSAMHMFIFPKTNKAIMFDTIRFGPSQIQLTTKGCRPKLSERRVRKLLREDCWSHAVEFHVNSGLLRALKLTTDTWSSSGGFSPNGTLVNAGGWSNGGKSVRYLSGCRQCDWEEHDVALSSLRWYSTQQILPDGSFILVGGRRKFSYEYIPTEGNINPTSYGLPFLRKTTDLGENNLYPFVFLSTDGNLFIFANNRSILLDPSSNRVVRRLPTLPGGSRNYPASGTAALLPIRLQDPNPDVIRAEVLVCGGAKPDAAEKAGMGILEDALTDCGRIDITDPRAKWIKEAMPSPRVMGDMLLLPVGDVLIINGAKKGTSGPNFADDPNLQPLLYRPEHPVSRRFQELQGTAIPRMYHSTAAVLPDGRVLLAGSNPQNLYTFAGVKYPTELRVEKFHPPYLDPILRSRMPLIGSGLQGKTVRYGRSFDVGFGLRKWELGAPEVRVTAYAPPFTTHGVAMNQRLLVLAVKEVRRVEEGVFRATVVAPPTAAVAPPGFYLVFVVNRGVPSPGVWLRFG